MSYKIKDKNGTPISAGDFLGEPGKIPVGYVVNDERAPSGYSLITPPLPMVVYMAIEPVAPFYEIVGDMGSPPKIEWKK